MNRILEFIVVVLLTWFSACAEKTVNHNAHASHPTVENSPAHSILPTEPRVKAGTLVPNLEVCMVNDMYMGTKQIEVKHNGKQYYGCCDNCKARIEHDPSVRFAVDPLTKNQVDKALAVIAITGHEGEVSYFESMDSYDAFFNK